jgi:ATP-binding cassette subfamily B protein
MMEDVQRALAGAERVFEILDEKSSVNDAPGAINLGKADGEIVFEDVNFQYEDDIPILEDISFHVKPWTTLAIVGPTGVGKSTIAKLISRFYDPTKGKILIDGKDTRDVTQKSLRENLSIVLQDVFLFNGTIADNISYSKQNATRDEVVEAAKAAYIHDFIEDLPKGYDTMVGERGLRLSGGQKQRVAIARAILKNASILILDEATSAVDTETETEIQNAINGLSGKCTMIIIAHRLSTVRKADNIIVLTENKITEQGTHDRLMEQKGIYSRLYTLQYEAQINRLM